MDSYGLDVIGRVAVEDRSVKRVPMQNYRWRLHAITFTLMVGMWPQNGGWGRPKYQMKAEDKIFCLVYPKHTNSYVP